MNGETGAAILVALTFIGYFVHETRPIRSVEADVLVCENPKAETSVVVPGCKKLSNSGRYSIALNRAANTCAWAIKDARSGSSAVRAGSHLSYVNEDNWSCEVIAAKMGESSMVETIEELDGKMRYTVSWYEPSASHAPTEHAISRADGVMGRLKHWARELNS